MTITIEQAADLVISGPGTVREKIIAGIEAYVKSLPNEQLCEDEGCPHHGTEHVCIAPPATLDKGATQALNAARWEKIETLMILGDVELNQEEDGGYRIFIDPVENYKATSWYGDTPEQAIDAALASVQGGE